MTSSAEDMLRLHRQEIDMLQHILQRMTRNQVNDQLLARFNYTLEMIEKTDSLHPVDSYNLIKRTARMWPNVSQTVEAVRDIVEARWDC